ncbi:MAG: DUF927 domain-containing protein, partial [Bryobacteraceae bacterium]
MGAITNALAVKPVAHVDFKAVSEFSSRSVETVVSHFLPGGRWEGNEYVVRNPTRNDATPGSFKIRRDGIWSDFATGQAGGDMIDLVVYLTGQSKTEAARELSAMLNVPPATGSTSLTGNVRALTSRKPSIAAATPEQARTAPETFPARTKPDADNKPRFIVGGEEGPSIRDNEKRRHIYRQGGVPVRIKIVPKDRDPLNVYRVTSDDGVTGWQYGKPENFSAVVPYFVGESPFDRGGPLFWPEGEKDVETLARARLAAFTFGGISDLPTGCEEYIRGRDVVILADNDDGGRKHAQDKAVLASPVAASVRIIHFPELANKQDVTDWIEAGHTFDELNARVESAEFLEDSAGDADPVEQHLLNRTEQKLSFPHGFSFSDRGLMWSNPDDLDKPAILVAGHFDLVAETRDSDGTSWGVLLHWKDHDGRDHRFALPRASLAGDGSEARRALMDGGFFIAPSQTARGLFNSFLLQVKSPNRARATQRVGWHGNSFVMPDDCFGSDERDTLLLQSATAHEHSFRQSG